MSRATVFIADSNALSRLGLRTVLQSIDGFEVVGEAIDDLEAVERIDALRPDLAIVALYLPVHGGLEFVAGVSRRRAETRCILVADEPAADPHSVLAMGAAGFALAGGDASEVRAAIEAVLRGKTYVSPTAGEPSRAGPRPAAGAVHRLSPRQREVLRLIGEGESTREIAEHLERSIKTIETHRAQLMRRLEATSVADLVKVAIRAGLVRLSR